MVKKLSFSDAGSFFFGIVRSKSVDEKKRDTERERGIFKKGRVSVLYSSVEQS